jgi:hypothetical protein
MELNGRVKRLEEAMGEGETFDGMTLARFAEMAHGKEPKNDAFFRTDFYVKARHLLPDSPLFDHPAIVRERERLGLPHTLGRELMVEMIEVLAISQGFSDDELAKLRNSMRPRPQRMVAAP